MKNYLLLIPLFVLNNVSAGELTCIPYSFKYELTGQEAVSKHILNRLQRKIFIGSANTFRHGTMINIDLENKLFAVDGNEFDIVFENTSVKWKYLGFNRKTKEYRQYIQSYDIEKKVYIFTSYPNDSSYEPDSKSITYKSNCER